MSILVPPIKCQGIKTKLVPSIRAAISEPIHGAWIEPFCGSCVVAFNLRPRQAILSDTNRHLISFYRAIQTGVVHPDRVAHHLTVEGALLRQRGEAHYYEIRKRFHDSEDPLDFLFLNRACFNGLMRFNRQGLFNVPFCRKPDRFRPAHVTRIANQVKAVRDLLCCHHWEFSVADCHAALARARRDDFVYADPPYHGRTTDYFNTWTAEDERRLFDDLRSLPCRFALSSWVRNRFRENAAILDDWDERPVRYLTIDHFYHVGSTESRRHAMVEALLIGGQAPVDTGRAE